MICYQVKCLHQCLEQLELIILHYISPENVLGQSSSYFWKIWKYNFFLIIDKYSTFYYSIHINSIIKYNVLRYLLIICSFLEGKGEHRSSSWFCQQEDTISAIRGATRWLFSKLLGHDIRSWIQKMWLIYIIYVGEAIINLMWHTTYTM